MLSTNSDQYFYPNLPFRLWSNSDAFLRLDNHPDWVAEKKYNGWRLALTMTSAGKIIPYSRHKTIISNFPDILIDTFRTVLKPGMCLDGEFLDRRSKTTKGEVCFFDIIALNGEISEGTLEDRYSMLQDIVAPILSEKIIIAERYDNDRVNLYNNCITEPNIEGLVLKKRKSRYIPSYYKCEINPAWFKVKKDEEHFKADH